MARHNRVQHIERLSRASVMLRATWYEGTAQLLSLTELKSHLFEFYFIGRTIKPMKDELTKAIQQTKLWQGVGRGWYPSRNLQSRKSKKP